MCNVHKLHAGLRFIFISALLLHLYYLEYKYLFVCNDTYYFIFACMKRTVMSQLL